MPTSMERLEKINEILHKYDYKISNTDLTLQKIEYFYKDHENKTLKEISNELTRSTNCIKEIMRVLYNVGDLKENKDTGSKDVENYIPTGYVC